jgi:hypothetical protein
MGHRGRDIKMNWDAIERDWSEFRAEVRANWTRLTKEQLDLIAGKRNLLASAIQDSYAVTSTAAQLQVSAFEARNKERRVVSLR